jgi:hypothetical protein
MLLEDPSIVLLGHELMEHGRSISLSVRGVLRLLQWLQVSSYSKLSKMKKSIYRWIKIQMPVNYLVHH